MHILPVDELYRQLLAGEIDRHYYETARDTQPAPAERLCQTPRCTRQAHVIQRERALCAVCAMVERSRRS